uniref:Uncharacterized protein n=1 Tax=Globisporangium ultimum (strain ATCC 200006 / CBS 805.95 / DAOM BR144) TaxID=431595 RepID=K3X0W9_GLOUD
MRMQHESSAACGYGGLSHAGYLFERQRATRRQNSFARARNALTKRKHRDDDDSSNDEAPYYYSNGRGVQGNKHVLEGLKRMRVTSPPTSPEHEEGASAGATDCMMQDDVQALVPVSKPRIEARIASKWTPTGYFQQQYASELTLPPTDPSCTAIVLFDPVASIPRAPAPCVELVDSEEDERAPQSPTGSDEDEEPFCRFEEIHDDDDVPMEID